MKFPLMFAALVVACGSPSQGGDRHGTRTAALYEDDEMNCGAEGYACVGGRECVSSRCEPAWIEMEDDGAPTPRGKAGAGVVDGKYVVFGGCTSTVGTPSAEASGGKYDPSNDTWDIMDDLEEGRAQLTSVSTPSGIFLSGGLSTCWDGASTGPGMEALFAFDGDWTRLPFPNAPSPGYDSSLVWMDREEGSGLFQFGGSNEFSSFLSSASSLYLGEAWENVDSTVGSRGGTYSSFFDNGMVHVWGGGEDSGLLFDTDHKKWYEWTLPSGTPDFDLVSTGGSPPRFADDGRRLYYLSADEHVLIFDRETQSWEDDSPTVPSGYCPEGATAWVGGEVVVWSGLCGGTFSSVGARYQPPAP